jgi:Rrf2 family transcriptional regulator, cysteine metabolism repressor
MFNSSFPVDKEQCLFTLSARAVYGLTAVVELALRRDQGPVQIRDIAGAHDIPQHYLEQILVALKKSGIVESVRGAQGGYCLARPPAGISVEEVLAVLDGKLELVPDGRRDGALSFYWRQVEEELRKTLQGTVQDLVLRLQHAAGQLHYSI